MEALCDCNWVNQMAGTLVCEIIDLMAGIQLRNHPAWGEAAKERDIDAIYGFVEGDVPMKLRFLAEPRMLSRLARNMLGSEPEKGEAQEYAMEFFNILCGRFISELYKATETTTRFFFRRGMRHCRTLQGWAGIPRSVPFILSAMKRNWQHFPGRPKL